MGGKNSGRYPKASAEHLMGSGVFRPSVHGDRVDVVKPSPMSSVDPPSRLNRFAVEVWHSLYAKVVALGQVSESETELFAAYCVAAGKLRQAQEEMKDSGPLVKEEFFDEKTRLWKTIHKPHPWYAIEREATSELVALGRQLGLTCIDRAKVIKTKGAPSTTIAKSRPKTALDALGPLKLVSGD